MTSENARIKWIDLARAVAICFVILCHATESMYGFAMEDIMSVSVPSRIFCFISFTFGRIGVPLFLMITGSLLLTRDYDDEGVKQFWKKKWLHLLICTLIWFVIYDIFLWCFYHEPVNLIQFIDEMLFFRSVNMGHAWYLPMILGIYILLPFVASVLKKNNNKLFIFPLIIFTAFSFGYSTFNVVYKGLFADIPLSNQFSLGFSGGIYGLMVLYGYFIGKGAFSKIKTGYIIAAFLLSFIAVVCMQFWAYQKGAEYPVWYDNLFLLFASMGLFELFRRMKHIYGYRVIKVLSRYAFPIYLTHTIVRALFKNLIRATAISKPIQELLFWAICLSISFLISWLISKIPRVGKYILFM